MGGGGGGGAGVEGEGGEGPEVQTRLRGIVSLQVSSVKTMGMSSSLYIGDV